MMLTSEHWRERATHALTLARSMHDREGQRLMREIAERYEKLAKLTEATAHDPPTDRREPAKGS